MADNGKREQAALLLAEGQDARSTAATLAIGERTLGRWKLDDAFRKRVNELRAEMITRAVGRLSAGLTDAAAKLRSLLNSEDERIALAAARSMLDVAPRLREHVELSDQLSDLEARITEIAKR